MFQYAPDQEKKDDTEVIQVDGKDDQEVPAGEKAKRPEPPKIDGYTFKDWGDAEENLDNVQDDIVAVAEYTKEVKIIPKAPKDPAAPDKDLEPFGEAITYEPGKDITKELPDPPEKEGWKPTGKWNPDPKSIKDPEEDVDIVPEYEKAEEDSEDGPAITFKIYDPNDDKKEIATIGEPITKFDPGKFEYPKAIDYEDKIPEGYEVDQENEWKPPASELDKKGYIDNEKGVVKKAVEVRLQLKAAKASNDISKHDFVVKVVDTKDSESPDDKRNDIDVASIHVVCIPPEKTSQEELQKAEKEDFKVPSDWYKFETKDLQAYVAKLSEDKEKNADKIAHINKVIEENEAAFKKIENISEIEDKHKPYKFQKWQYGDTKCKDTKSFIEELTKNGKPTEEQAIIKPVFNNDMQAKHTELDFYILPMKGLKDKDKKSSDNK